MADEHERSESGNPIIRHEARERGLTPADMSDSCMGQITDHVEKHIGPIESVFHEIISDLVHVDVHYVPATDRRPWITLVTSGMSDLPMAAPEGCEAFSYAELMINLPSDWPISDQAFKDENNYWPVRWLKVLARMPHECETWISYGHSIPNGNPPEPFARNTKLCCMLLVLPLATGSQFAQLKIRDDKIINFCTLMPIFKQEVDLKLRIGTEALEELFDQNDITDIVDVSRTNVARKKRFGFF